MVHKQEMSERKEKEKNGAITKGSDELKITCTNRDGIVARKLALADYLKEKKHEIVCLAETKLCEDIQTNIKNCNYIWRKDRKNKQGGGVMLMIKSEIKD